MKIIFDSHEQKEKFLNAISDCFGECPSYFGFTNRVGIRNGHCLPSTDDDCHKCWERCGIEFEVKGESQ